MTDQARAVRVTATAPVTCTAVVPDNPAFACAYAAEVAPEDRRTSEQWARAAWENSPAPTRWLMRWGWHRILGLRVGPLHSPAHILGWEIVERRDEETVCHLRSPILHAYNVFRRDSGQLIWSTFVFYDKRVARLVWPAVSLLHRPLVRITLGTAKRQAHQDLH